MTLSRIRGAVRRRWLVLVLSILIGAVVGAGYVATSSTVYRSTTTVFFSLDRGTSVSEFTAGSTYAQDLVPSYAQVVTMPVVLEPVISSLQLDVQPQALARKISVAVQPNTVLLDITVTDAVPATAAGIANAVAEQLAQAVSTLSPRGGAESPRIRVTTTSPAVAAAEPSSTDPLLIAAGLLLAGLLVGVGIVALLEVVTRPLRTRESIAEVTDAPVVGNIVHERGAGKRPVPTITDPQLVRAERYRILRANLRFLKAGRQPISLAVTSALPYEGRTTTALNLAVAMAQTSDRVLLVDADLRTGRVADLLGITSSTGLSTILSGSDSLESAIKCDDKASNLNWAGSGLSVLPAGRTPPNPGELLASPAMEKVMVTLRSMFDVIVLDTAPLLTTADAGTVAGLAGNALVVIDTTRTLQQHLVDAADRLHMAGANMLGIVLNKSPMLRSDHRLQASAPAGAPVQTAVLGSAVTSATAPASPSPTPQRRPSPYPRSPQQQTSSEQPRVPARTARQHQGPLTL